MNPRHGGDGYPHRLCRICFPYPTPDGVPDILKSCVGPWLLVL